MFGFTAMALALFYTTSLDLQMSFAYAAKLRFRQSIGLAFLVVPINTLIYVGVPPGKNNDVSGLSNLARNVGGSAGTSFFTTMLASISRYTSNIWCSMCKPVAGISPAGRIAHPPLAEQHCSCGRCSDQSDSDYLPISASTGQRLELYRRPPISQLYLRLHGPLGLPDEATTEGNAGSGSRIERAWRPR